MLCFTNVLIKQKNLFISMPKRIRNVRTKLNLPNNRSPAKKKKNSDTFHSTRMNTIHPVENNEPLKTPIISENDKKEYRVICLENGLIACLISDPSGIAIFDEKREESDDDETDSENENDFEEDDNEESDESNEIDNIDEHDEKKIHHEENEEKLAAASLCVGVGSFSDPDSIPGLAHFVEHMVFMGSKKYPKENAFDAFLKKRGGGDNASTECETTSFYFECLEKYLAKALDMWAQFFISPLMNKDSMTREREAIESEFQIALPSDIHRKEQMFTLFAKPNSPPNKFLWGNLKTLRDNVTDDELHKSVHAFRDRHYSAHRMTLAVQARLPLDVLEDYVINSFSSIPNNKLPADNFHRFTDIFDSGRFRKMYYVKPVKDVNQIDLNFALPSLLPVYKTKPHQYVSWLLGHEGKGSLLSYLKEKLWVHTIFTGNAETGIEHNSMYCLFAVTLVLTTEGLNHIPEIIQAVFSYIQLLKEVGPVQRIYNEIKLIEDTKFRFHEEEDASDFVEEIALSMQYYPPEDYIIGNQLFMEYNSSLISMVLEKMNPNNLNIMILASTLPDDIKFEKTEPWFSIPYMDKDIPSDWIEQWTNVKPYKNFDLPSHNNFISTKFDLLNLCPENVPEYPEKLISDDLIEFWYKPDNKFKLPHAFIRYYFMNNYALDSGKSACMLNLFVHILNFQLTEEVYPATVAELNYEIIVKDYGIVLKLNGYNEKLPLLLELIIKYMKDVPNKTTEKVFDTIKNIVTKEYYNTFINPSKLSRILRISVLQSVSWNALIKFNIIPEITFNDFIQFSKDFLKCMHIQGLIQGNISKTMALKVNHNMMSVLDFEPLPYHLIKKIRVNQLPIGKECIKTMSFNKNDTNSIVTSYYQIGISDIKLVVTLELLMLLMEEPLFDRLRTKEQLGYDVQNLVNDTHGIFGFSVIVNCQAGKFSTNYVDTRIDEFLNTLSKTLKRMSEKQIHNAKDNLRKIKKVVDIHLKHEVDRNWYEIEQQDFVFDRIPKEIEAIKEIKISEVRNFLEFYSINPSSYRKLSVQVLGHTNSEPCEISETKSETELSESNSLHSVPHASHLELLNNINEEDDSSAYKCITDLENYRKNVKLFPDNKKKD